MAKESKPHDNEKEMTESERIEALKKKVDELVNKSKKKKSKKEKKMEEQYQSRREARQKRIDRYGRAGTLGGLGLAGAVLDGGLTYMAERAEDPNGSKLVDGVKSMAVAGAWLVAPGPMWGYTLGSGAVGLGKMFYEDAEETYEKHKSQSLHITKDASGSNKGTLSGNVVDSEQAMTLRQRSEQVMRQHKIATESILGSEARQLHR